MSSDAAGRGSLGISVLIIVLLLLFSWLTMEVSYPAFEFASDLLSRQLIPVEPFSAIAGRVSRFLWENRALDLTGQAFVIVAAIICCMAMLKHEGAAS